MYAARCCKLLENALGRRPALRCSLGGLDGALVADRPERECGIAGELDDFSAVGLGEIDKMTAKEVEDVTQILGAARPPARKAFGQRGET